MKRTQIYLDEELYELLQLESKVRKTRMSSLIREALRDKYFEHEKKEVVINSLFGIWKDREFDSEGHLRICRGETRIIKKRKK